MPPTVRVQTSSILNEYIALLPILLLLVLVTLWLWALIDTSKNPRLTNNERLVWVLVVLFLNWLGSILYLIVGRRGRASGSAA